MERDREVLELAEGRSLSGGAERSEITELRGEVVLKISSSRADRSLCSKRLDGEENQACWEDKIASVRSCFSPKASARS